VRRGDAEVVEQRRLAGVAPGQFEVPLPELLRVAAPRGEQRRVVDAFDLLGDHRPQVLAEVQPALLGGAPLQLGDHLGAQHERGVPAVPALLVLAAGVERQAAARAGDQLRFPAGGAVDQPAVHAFEYAAAAFGQQRHVVEEVEPEPEQDHRPARQHTREVHVRRVGRRKIRELMFGRIVPRAPSRARRARSAGGRA